MAGLAEKPSGMLQPSQASPVMGAHPLEDRPEDLLEDLLVDPQVEQPLIVQVAQPLSTEMEQSLVLMGPRQLLDHHQYQHQFRCLHQ